MKTLVRGAGVIDGTGSGYRSGTALLLEGDRLVAVGAEGELRGHADDVLDLGGATLLPGFVDAHTHITVRPGEGDQHGQLRSPPVRQALRGVENMRRVLHSGVTTIRVMGEIAGIDFEFKRAVNQGDLPGPRMLVAGKALSATHGHGAALGVADGPEGLRIAVRENLRDGADHIKIFATGGVSNPEAAIDAHHYSREEIRATVEEAHRAGATVAAHAHGGEGVDICVDEGVDSIEHGGLLTSRNIEAIFARGTRLVLTNSITFHPSGIEAGDAGNAEIVERVRRVRETIEGTFLEIRAAGLRFALGTDSMHGLFGYEIEWLVERGVEPEEAVVAA
ncbi:amidohydrolase family protein, partial [uncultured Arthrobacter sp.]|uniref:amidohydrolase family protein n=1 Tax=uncultured Arthrobacter sp. TaxID=114050 RepID=UPI0025D9128C